MSVLNVDGHENLMLLHGLKIKLNGQLGLDYYI